MAQARAKVAGSDKKALPSAKVIGDVDRTKRIEVTVLLRPRQNRRAADALLRMASKRPAARTYTSREDFAELCGADPGDVAKVEAFAHDHNLTVVNVSAAKRSVRLAGTLGDLITAFQPRMKRYKLGGRVFRGRTGALSVPRSLASAVVGVLGFDDRPAARSHSRFRCAASPAPGAVAAPRREPRRTTLPTAASAHSRWRSSTRSRRETAADSASESSS